MTYIKCPTCGREEPAFDYAHVCGPVQVKKSFNERLRKFERESKLEIFGLGARREIWERALEKYAELIIQDCDQYARSTWEHGPLLGSDLKRLFGFEKDEEQ
jgi:hypothetical protein